MEARLQKWGNSDGIRIPSNFLKSLDLKTDDVVELLQVEDTIIISKPKKKHMTLEERFKMYEDLTVEETAVAESYDWGEDIGKEIID